MNIIRISTVFVPPWRGLGPGPFELSNAQVETGIKLTVITKHVMNCESFDKKLPYEVVRIKASFDLYFSFCALLYTLKIIRTKRIDIIHSHGYSALFHIIFKKIFFNKIPIVSSVHILRKYQMQISKKISGYKKLKRELLINSGIRINNDSIKKSLFFEKIFIKYSDFLVTVSDEIKQNIKKYYHRYHNVDVIYNGVNPKVFNMEKLNKNFKNKISKSKKNIIFVGGLNCRKGEFDLLNAFEMANINDCKLIYVGNGLFKPLLKSYILKKNLQNKIILFDNLPHNELKKLFKICDLFVLPSYSEGLPKVLLEAIFSKVNVLVSDIGCHREIVGDNNGYLFNLGNIEDLSNKLVHALDDIESKNKIELAYDCILKNYTWKNVADRLNNTYIKVKSKNG